MYMYYKVLIMSSVYTHKGLRDVLRGRALIIHDNSAYNVILLKMHTLYVDPASRGLELSSMCVRVLFYSVFSFLTAHSANTSFCSTVAVNVICECVNPTLYCTGTGTVLYRYSGERSIPAL